MSRAKARAELIAKAVTQAAVHTSFSLENLMACGVFSGTPCNAIACELAEQVLDLGEQLLRVERQLAEARAAADGDKGW